MGTINYDIDRVGYCPDCQENVLSEEELLFTCPICGRHLNPWRNTGTDEIPNEINTLSIIPDLARIRERTSDIDNRRISFAYDNLPPLINMGNTPHDTSLHVAAQSLLATMESMSTNKASDEIIKSLRRTRIDRIRTNTVVTISSSSLKKSITLNGTLSNFSPNSDSLTSGPLNASNPLTADRYLTNASVLENSIVFCIRGKCTFAEKTRNVQMAKAAALIVMQEGPVWPFYIKDDIDTDDLKIPVVMISNRDGDFLIELMQRNKIVNCTISIKQNNDDCIICQEPYKLDSMVITLPCAHIFHEDCVCKWLSKHNATCPTCRYDLVRSQAETITGGWMDWFG